MPSPSSQLYKVPDHRVPISIYGLYASRKTFHQWPAHSSRRYETHRGCVSLVRVEPDGSGPLPDMCGVGVLLLNITRRECGVWVCRAESGRGECGELKALEL